MSPFSSEISLTARKRLSNLVKACFAPFDMVKNDKDGWTYTLKIPYETEEELDETIDEMMGEASYIADLRNGFIEMSVTEPATDKSW